MTTKRKRRRRRRRIRRQTLRGLCLMGMVLVCAAAVFAGTQAVLSSYVKKNDDGRILSGVSVGHTDVSGMSREEALGAVQKEVTDCGAVVVTLKIAEGEEFEASLKELGLSSPKIEEAVDNAVEFGKNGNTTQSYKMIKKAEKKKLKHRIPLEYELGQKEAAKILSSRSQAFLETPVNAAIVQAPEGAQVTESHEGEVLNTEQTIENLTQFLNDDWDGKPGQVQAVIEKRTPL